ncbi:MAG: MmcB family DNA repair protein [Neomegalonema sp.]|nr:MmcB family DNA repair protein [Neomegalonema sp.]
MRPETTAMVRRGARRRLAADGMETLMEFAPTRGLRADLLAIGRAGELWIIEVKSCLEDYAADAKWRGYLEWCDQFFFAVGPEFPTEKLPAEAGLILSDGYDAELVRRPEARKVAGARRRAILIKAARHASARLRALEDPGVAALRRGPDNGCS